MAYEYSDPTREDDPHALPDVEVFQVTPADLTPGATGGKIGNPEDMRDSGITEPGFYFAFGFPGCLWDGEPEGPYPSYEDALQAARGLNG